MEVVTALLQELLILSSVLRLLRLLLESARANLRLSPLQRRLLGTRAKPAKLLAQLLHSLPVSLLRTEADTLLLLGGLKRLLIVLLIQRGDCLRLSKALLTS